ncbi:MAG: PhaM family polyhydroxyalkanoate granule multifunctional regulatory protein [Burkholderiaceae bacterium]
MSIDPSTFAKLVPGFDFLQGLVKNAGSALPGIGQWVAPTLNPEELEKRITELRTVQYWLEQNAKMLSATIQALEVQRMTLSTLKTMNVQMGDLRDSITARLPGAAGTADAAQTKSSSKSDASAKAPVVDPMQWWSALTQQFAQLAAGAMKDSASEAVKGIAGAMVKQGLDVANQGLKRAAALPAAVVRAPAAKRKRAPAAKR